MVIHVYNSSSASETSTICLQHGILHRPTSTRPQFTSLHGPPFERSVPEAETVPLSDPSACSDTQDRPDCHRVRPADTPTPTTRRNRRVNSDTRAAADASHVRPAGLLDADWCAAGEADADWWTARDGEKEWSRPERDASCYPLSGPGKRPTGSPRQ